MRKRLWWGLFLLLLAPPVRALPFFDDPGVVYALGIVSDLLQAIQKGELAVQLTLQKGIRGLVADVGFPEGLFAEIQQTLSLVQGIRDEVTALSCGFRFSPRTSLLRDLLLGLHPWCRREFEGVWGSPVGRSADLEGFRNYLGTLSTNLVSRRVDRAESWLQAFPAAERDSALFRVSPGEASRDEAALLAATARVADSNSALKTQTLLLEQLEAAADRREERQGLDMARFILQDAAGLDPWHENP